MTSRVRHSTGNVFRDLGFGEDEAENLKIRADLMIELTKLIEAQESRWTPWSSAWSPTTLASTCW